MMSGRGESTTSHLRNSCGRCLSRVVLASAARPSAVADAALAAVAASIALASFCLDYRFQRDDLLSSDSVGQVRWQNYLAEFGSDDDFIFVVRGGTREELAAAADDLAAALREHSGQFDRVFHAVDFSALQTRALQLLDTSQLHQLAGMLRTMAPLLAGDPLAAWSGVTAEMLAGREQELAAFPRERFPPGGVLHAFTPDGRMILVLARPLHAAESLEAAENVCRAARDLIAAVRQRHPGLEFGLTGLPVLESDEMRATAEDTRIANAIALCGVALFYLAVYRGIRRPLLTIATLATGATLALGWAAITVGHLNVLSAAFAIMIIGIGDYGVLWLAHYDAARAEGSAQHALAHAAERAGPGILTAAITSAMAFFACSAAEFQAVAELGWIAGWGILFCCLSCFTLLPAMIVLTERRMPHGAAAMANPAPINVDCGLLGRIAGRPRLVLLAAAVVCLAGMAGLPRVRYDANLLNLQSQGFDSVYWEHQLIAAAPGATWDALSIAESPAAARQLRKQFEALPGVGEVIEAASLLPAADESKEAMLADIRARLAGLPETLPASLIGPGVPQADADARRRLHADLLALRSASDPRQITEADLPPAFRERYISPGGKFLVRVHARESLWDNASLERFTAAIHSIDPQATGKSFRTVDGLRQMRAGFAQATALAFVVIVAVLAADLRSIRQVALALIPLALGLIVTFGMMGWAGVSLNPANLVALPLILGVGVDNGVHVIHDSREQRRGRYRLGRAAGRGIAVAGFTTILCFGTLMIGRHQGMASLGFTLALGVAACMAAALIVLPALLHWSTRGIVAAVPAPAARSMN